MNPMGMMNHPIMKLMNAYRGGQNPMQVLSSLSGNNPVFGQGMSMIQGKTPEQIRQMADNMARQRGLDARQIAQQFGFPIR